MSPGLNLKFLKIGGFATSTLWRLLWGLCNIYFVETTIQTWCRWCKGVTAKPKLVLTTIQYKKPLVNNDTSIKFKF